jgi:hypothetical protein
MQRKKTEGGEGASRYQQTPEVNQSYGIQQNTSQCQLLKWYQYIELLYSTSYFFPQQNRATANFNLFYNST